MANIDLSLFRNIFSASPKTPLFSAGGWNNTNCWGVIEGGSCDALAIGRYFLSTPDLVERLKEGRELNPYDRLRFYGPFEDRALKYTDYLTWDEMKNMEKSGTVA